MVNKLVLYCNGDWSSVVSIGCQLWAGRYGDQILSGARYFLSKTFIPGVGTTQPPEPWFRFPVLEADHLPTFSTKVDCSYTSVPRICLRGGVCCFTFTDIIEICCDISSVAFTILQRCIVCVNVISNILFLC
jgi:hypothetical protein